MRALATCLVLLLAGLPSPATATDDSGRSGGLILREKKKRRSTSTVFSILLPLGSPEGAPVSGEPEKEEERNAEQVTAGALMELSPEARRDFFEEAAPGLPLPENFGSDALDEAQEELSHQYYQGMADTLKVMSQAAGANAATLPPRFKPGELGAKGAAKAFGGLSRAAEFGIKPYSELRRLLEGTGLRAHHLIEKRFANQMGQDAREMLAIAVTPAEHQAFTNAWRKLIPYNTGAKAVINVTREQVLAVAKEIYSRHPEILKALGL